MSIVVRRGRPVVEPRSRLLRFERPTTVDAAATAIGRPSIELDEPHELARLALDVVVRTSEPMSVPPQWKTVPFGREVESTRAQLGPIRSRSSLARSFAREASIAVTRTATPSVTGTAAPNATPGVTGTAAPNATRSVTGTAAPNATPSVTSTLTPGPVRVAYAVRWLELGDDRPRPSWTAIVSGVVGDLVAAVATMDRPST